MTEELTRCILDSIPPNVRQILNLPMTSLQALYTMQTKLDKLIQAENPWTDELEDTETVIPTYLLRLKQETHRATIRLSTDGNYNVPARKFCQQILTHL